jgi:hypothetical protein
MSGVCGELNSAQKKNTVPDLLMHIDGIRIKHKQGAQRALPAVISFTD